jgi:hypothetical protein
MKLLYLNCIISIPNEAGEEKIQKATNRDEPRINYEALGLPTPKDEVETDEDGRVVLEEDDVDYITVPLTMPIDNLDSWVSSTDGGSRVYTKSNLAYDVIEEVWEIDSVVEYTTMSWIEKKYLSFKSFLRQCRNYVLKNKITGKKTVNLEELFSRPENQIDYKQEELLEN